MWEGTFPLGREERPPLGTVTVVDKVAPASPVSSILQTHFTGRSTGVPQAYMDKDTVSG